MFCVAGIVPPSTSTLVMVSGWGVVRENVGDVAPVVPLDPSKLASPLYVAVTVSGPGTVYPALYPEQEAVPPETGAVQMVPVASLKVTVPVGVKPETPVDTVAVKVCSVPAGWGPTPAVSFTPVTVVAPLSTTWTAGDPLAEAR